MSTDAPRNPIGHAGPETVPSDVPDAPGAMRDNAGEYIAVPSVASPGGLQEVAGRDPATGRFAAGNRAAVVVGEYSADFWRQHAAARDEIRRAVIADAGCTEADAPRALSLAADSIAQAAFVRDAAYLRMVETGGPLSSKTRPRRAFVVWSAAVDRLERHLRLVGLRRVPRSAPSARDIMADIVARREREP